MNKEQIALIFKENYLKILGVSTFFNGSLKEIYIIDRNANTFTYSIEKNIPSFKGVVVHNNDKVFENINIFKYFSTPNEITKCLPTFTKYYRKQDIFNKILNKDKKKKEYKI